jgi:hypothetical protein
VTVNGLITGAEVVLSVDGTEFTHIATGGGHTFTVPTLDPGAVLTARQDDGSGPTPPSPPVIVENAAVPPTSSPLFPAEVGSCSQCVRLAGLVPGCEIEVMQAGNVVGTGVASRHGDACIRVELRGARQDPGPDLTARMIVCGDPGPLSGISLVPDPPPSAPVVGSPLFGCQRVVPLHALRRGATTGIETDTGTFLGRICNCWTDVNVNVLHPLVPGERVRARQFWESPECALDGPWSGWQDVVPPDERIKPEVREALVEGDQIIRVTNQIVGSDLVILIRDGVALEQRFGPRPASQEPEIALNVPLVAGQQVAVEQHLCGHMELSDWVMVLPAPPQVLAPVVLPPLYECAGAVQVSALHPGAVVRIFQDGDPSGPGWAGLSGSIAVVAAPALAAGARVTARQWVGGIAGPESDPTEVLAVPDLHQPRVVEPVAIGDTTVWVSGVTPGVLVSIYSGGSLIGEGFAGESLVPITVAPVPGVLHAEVRLCDRTLAGPRVEAIESPRAHRSGVGVGEQDLDYGESWVQMHPREEGGNDGGFNHPLRGRLYHPVDDEGNIPDTVRNRPVVIVAHGHHYCDKEDQSHLGYAYLAHHLVRWGMFVFSLDLAHVNDMSEADPTQQWSRGEIVLMALDRLFSDPPLGGRLNRERIGLVGHSMGGEGVVVAQVLNQSREMPPYGIRGVVSLAPTFWRPDVTLEGAKYLQLHGSRDRLLQDVDRVRGEKPPFNGFRLSDRAWRPRTHVWVHGARHRGWNTNWWNSVMGAPAPESGALTLDEHTEVARCFVNAFFQDALFNRSDYVGYFHGLVVPPSIDDLGIYLQHHSPAADVIDDFGDADDQLGTAEESPIEKTVNRAGGAAQASGGGLDRWDDTEHVNVHARSVHDTRSTDVAWLQPDVTYTTDFAPEALGPTDVLSFRVAQHYDEDAGGDPDVTYNPEGLDLDLLVEVGDGAQMATVRMGSAGVAPYPAPADESWAVFRTVQLPMDAFTAMNPALDLGGLRQVTFRLVLHPTGRVLVDDVEFV